MSDIMNPRSIQEMLKLHKDSSDIR